MRFAFLAAALFLMVGCAGKAAPRRDGGGGGGVCATSCTENGQCDYGNACRDGCCTPGCDSNADCVEGEICYYDRCVPDTGGGGGTLDGGAADGGPIRTDGGGVTPVDGGGAGGAAVGAACTSDTDCAGGSCFGLPGGYCSQEGCTVGDDSSCPSGSTCFDLSGGGTACFKTCGSSSECRQNEGYICDTDNTCYTGTTGGGDGGAPNVPVGGACTSDSNCGTGGSCVTEMSNGTATGWTNGYCIAWDCNTTGCPAGSTCLTVTSGGDTACIKTCSADGDCRSGYDCGPASEGSTTKVCWPGCAGPADCPQGYACDTAQTFCVPPAAQCSAQNPTGPCPAGQVCNSGHCEPFTCSDTRFEPNEVQTAAATAPAATTTGLALCAADVDWYKATVTPHTITRVGINYQRTSGDLDLALYDSVGACMGGRPLFGACSWTGRSYETGEEYLSVLNGAASGNKTYAWKVFGYGGATNLYSLDVKSIPFTDGRDCNTTTYNDCDGRVGGVTSLIQFPFADPSDGYVGDGYRFDSESNYRWLRRETIQLVRYAIKETRAKFDSTKALGLIDMCQHDGITPGYDVGSPRHPESTHDQGGNIDIAYFTTLAANGTISYNEARIVCDANEGNNDGSYCNASAAQTHVVDLPRQVYFMAKLYESARVRVIGCDKVIAPLLQAEANRQLGLGWITTAQKNAFTSKLAYGDGWPFHHHHIHLSLQWWGSALTSSATSATSSSTPGCGFDLASHRSGTKAPARKIELHR